ncbi:MAG TPA: endonuclease domain-containing protein [Allosphingosinicella sp.]|jgi:very-short-patch-repair endonuclease
MPRRKPVTRRNSAINRARQLRREPTPPEFRLWQALRLRPGELKFRRQHPFDRCTVDFFCPAARVVVEVDGDGHGMGDNPERDARRDAWLRSQGLEVLRFDARDVMNDVNSVVQAILAQARR